MWWGRRDTSNNFDFIGCSREAIDDRLKKTEEMAKNIYIGQDAVLKTVTLLTFRPLQADFHTQKIWISLMI